MYLLRKVIKRIRCVQRPEGWLLRRRRPDLITRKCVKLKERGALLLGWVTRDLGNLDSSLKFFQFHSNSFNFSQFLNRCSTYFQHIFSVFNSFHWENSFRPQLLLHPPGSHLPWQWPWQWEAQPEEHLHHRSQPFSRDFARKMKKNCQNTSKFLTLSP